MWLLLLYHYNDNGIFIIILLSVHIRAKMWFCPTNTTVIINFICPFKMIKHFSFSSLYYVGMLCILAILKNQFLLEQYSATHEKKKGSR